MLLYFIQKNRPCPRSLESVPGLDPAGKPRDVVDGMAVKAEKYEM